MAWAHWVGIGAVLGGLGVLAGAFGSHALQHRLDSRDLQIFETAVRYQIYHAIALMVLGLTSLRISGTAITVSGWSFLGGVFFFSGSLYTLVLTNTRWFGAITPIGGGLFILGWLSLAYACLTLS